ncbi:MAG: hypothetical protein WCT42_01835 [Candidatus Paceibacterota bacterium]
MNLDKLFPTNLYHSYVIEGDPVIIAPDLLSFLEIRGEILKNSPDVLCQVYESFTMDDSSQIKNWHSKKGVTEGKKICILATKFINREAEQTLLKIIEEPAINTHFFIIIPDSSVLLPTITSRVHIIKTNQEDNVELKKEVNSFLKSSPKERIDTIAKLIKDNKNEENSGQLRYYATQFVNETESITYEKFKKNKNNNEIKFILEEIQKSRIYLSTPGASVKMILEHLALVI